MADLQKLREQIAAGEYRLDAASIAGALLDYASVGDPSRAGDPTAPAFADTDRRSVRSDARPRT
jgi:hypothetical protein